MKVTIEEKKKISQAFKEVENGAKTEKCLMCNKKLTTHCNSHIVPQFVLKEIAENGKISYGATFFTSLNDIFETTKGVNNAFTFKMICKECDNKRFAKYENPDVVLNYEKLSIQEQLEVLSEMAIKNHLAHIWMKRNEIARHKVFFGIESQIIKSAGIKTAYDIDIEEHFKQIKRIRQFDKRTSFPYKVLFNELLDFKSGIATQTLFSYTYDLRGNKIFNRFDFRKENNAAFFYLTIFPLKNKTRIIFYIQKSEEQYAKSIVEDFYNLSFEDKLNFIFISLTSLDEQFYVTPSLADKMKKDKKFIKLYTKTDDGRLDNWEYCREIKNFRKYKNYLLPIKKM